MDTPAPATALCVLLVDDSAADLALNLRALRDLGRTLVTESVDSGGAMREALTRLRPDLILSDFSMPGFSGPEALAIARELTPEVPFIYVSGEIGEELAIEAMRHGAADYVLKGNLRRLQPAIERALLAARQQHERQQMEQALHDSEARFRTIVESSGDWIWETDLAGRHAYSNGSVATLLGHSPESLIGNDALVLMVEEDRRLVEAALPDLIARKHGWNNWVLRWHHRDGGVRLLESTAQPILDAAGVLVGYRGVDRDITLRAEQARKIEQLSRMHATLAAHGNAVLRAGDADELLDMTCRVAVEQGHFLAAVIGRPLPDNTLAMTNSFGAAGVIAMIAALGPAELGAPGAEQRPSVRAFVRAQKIITPDCAASDAPAALRAGMARVGIAGQISLPIGTPPWAVLELLSAAQRDYDGDEIALLERLAAQIDYARGFLAKSERLEYLAYHNPVTNLPNRSAFRTLLTMLVAHGPAVVAVLDVHRFARVNESRGRAFGDALLRQIGQRLATLGGPGCLLAHPEADSFLLAYSGEGAPGDEIPRLASLLDDFDRTGFVIDGEEAHVDLRGGIALAPVHGTDAETLELNAMSALAEAVKRDSRLHTFSVELSGRAAHRNELERALRRAIEAEEFELHYQPKFDAASQRLVGAEALLRWRRPQHGLVSPAEFVPVLEETGLIVAVGHGVMRRALATALLWRVHHPGFRIAVNVSARELRHAGFLDDCRVLLKPHLDDQPLDIEVTESLLMDDIDNSIQVLQALRDLGCRVAIDDFGTGYSSLNYLARLPVDELKIDQSFIATLAHSADTMGLVSHIITLAHSLSLKVVAEGVEEQQQAQLLRLLRCDTLQGYLLGRPQPAAEFAARVLNLGEVA